MADIDNGGPAFAAGCGDHGNGRCACEGPKGLTVRDYFVAKAIQGLLTNPSMISPTQLKASRHHENIVQLCFEIADAILAQRKKS